MSLQLGLTERLYSFIPAICWFNPYETEFYCSTALSLSILYMLLYFHSLNPTLPSSHDTFLHCHKLEFTFQLYLSHSYVVSAQLPVSAFVQTWELQEGNFGKTLFLLDSSTMPTNVTSSELALSKQHSVCTVLHISLSQAQSNIFIGKCTQILTLFTFCYSPTLPENRLPWQYTLHFSVSVQLSLLPT